MKIELVQEAVVIHPLNMSKWIAHVEPTVLEKIQKAELPERITIWLTSGQHKAGDILHRDCITTVRKSTVVRNRPKFRFPEELVLVPCD